MNKRKKLLNMLSYARAADSVGERAFIARHIETVNGIERDSYGNYHLLLGDSATLFSSHTDTVHRTEKKQQKIYCDSVKSIAYGDQTDVLGADNAAGVYVMLELIERGVPGHYVFHRGEEIGGLGSSYIAKHQPALLRSYDRAIAFDRKGEHDVITHQGGMRCCSDEFAYALAGELGQDMVPDDSGSFTDTANYDHIISECTNVSVGYHHAHSKQEYLDLDHLFNLVERLAMVDFEGLPVARDPSAIDNYNYWNTDFDIGSSYYGELDQAIADCDYDRVLDIVKRDPQLIADMLIG